MAITLGGGGGGAKINEYRFFVDRGDTFTDDDGQVWLKKGARSLDTTTYPDVHTTSLPVSTSTDYQAANVSLGHSSAKGLAVSEDGAWALNQNSGTQVAQTNIATDTVNTVTAYSGFTPYACSYVKVAASSGLSNSVSNANGYFAAILGSFGGTSLVSFNLQGGSGTNAGLPNGGLAAWLILRDSSGTGLNTGSYAYNSSATNYPAAVYWSRTYRRIYVMMAYAYVRAHLFMYNMSGNAWGNTNAGNGSSTTLNATSTTDWGSESDVYQIHHMSGDSTHLHVYYRNASYVYKIRKIPLSGNLSWSSGSDSATLPTSGLIEQASDGSFSTFGIRDYGPAYYQTVGGVDKYLVHTNTSGAGKLREINPSQPVIGEDTPDADAAQTQYQRIK